LLIRIVTALPAVVIVPPGGDWPTTVPAGLREATETSVGVKLARTRALTAASRPIPTT
jgi:hypothetical protein